MVITGADLASYINNFPAPMWDVFKVERGDIMSFKQVKKWMPCLFNSIRKD